MLFRSIRAEVSRRGLLSPTGAESFRLFANACQKRLIPEMKAAARLTLGYPMTFEYLGEALRSFEGWMLFDLTRFRRCCRDSITSCLRAFLNDRSGPSNIWVGCPTPRPPCPAEEDSTDLPFWFGDTIWEKKSQLSSFSSPLVTPSSFREGYLKALRDHVSDDDCSFCMKTHTLKGDEFGAEIENRLAQAWDVQYSFRIELPGSESTPPPVSIRYFSLESVTDFSQPTD